MDVLGWFNLTNSVEGSGLFKSKGKRRFIFLTSITCLVILTRLIPHPPNFTAVGAVALYGATMFDKKWTGLFISLTALLITDLLIGFHLTMFYVYASFILISVLGFLLRNNFKIGKLFSLSVAGSFLFYIITNFGMWFQYDFYPKTVHGLWLCYMAGLPYLLNTLLGDICYNALLFTVSMVWMKKKDLLPAHLGGPAYSFGTS